MTVAANVHQFLYDLVKSCIVVASQVSAASRSSRVCFGGMMATTFFTFLAWTEKSKKQSYHNKELT